MSEDTIYRQAAIDAVHEEFDECLVWDESGQRTADEFEIIINRLPSTQPETCEGCKHLGKWENEVEYGYSSPCTRCKRRAEDYYER